MEKIINNYAHDYRDMCMTEEQLKQLLKNFSKEALSYLATYNDISICSMIKSVL